MPLCLISYLHTTKYDAADLCGSTLVHVHRRCASYREWRSPCHGVVHNIQVTVGAVLTFCDAGGGRVTRRTRLHRWGGVGEGALRFWTFLEVRAKKHKFKPVWKTANRWPWSKKTGDGAFKSDLNSRYHVVYAVAVHLTYFCVTESPMCMIVSFCST